MSTEQLISSDPIESGGTDLSIISDSMLRRYSGRSPLYVLKKLKTDEGVETNLNDLYQKLREVEGFVFPRKKKEVSIEEFKKEYEELVLQGQTKEENRGRTTIVPTSVIKKYDDKDFTRWQIYDDLRRTGYNVSRNTVNRRIKEEEIKIKDDTGGPKPDRPDVDYEKFIKEKKETLKPDKELSKSPPMRYYTGCDMPNPSWGESTPCITDDQLTIAIRNSIDKSGMSREEARLMAQHVLEFFGYSDRIVDNTLEKEDRDAFYMLEDSGILTTEREETKLYDGRDWRIHYWLFRKDKIKELVDNYNKTKEVKEDAGAIYGEISENIWQREEIAINDE